MPPANPSVRLRGEPGFDAGLYYVFDNIAAMADPGAGELRLDNGTLASVTAAAISELTFDSGNPDVSAWLDALLSSGGTPKAYVEIYNGNDRTNWFRGAITAVTDNSGWKQLTLTHLASSGTLANGAALRVVIAPTGETGTAWDQWQGAWLTSTAYLKNDLVENDGSSYTALSDHTSDASTEPGVGASWASAWDLAAAKGEQGNTGDPGATGPAWDQWQGAWQTTTDYAANDVVENDGASYVCILGHTSGDTDDEPGAGATEATYWDLLAAAGADGTGDMTGPGSSTDGHAALFDGATGKLLKSAGAAPSLVGHGHTLSDISDAGTAAAADLGTSGGAVGLLNGANTWSGVQAFDAGFTMGLAGAAEWGTFDTGGATGGIRWVYATGVWTAYCSAGSPASRIHHRFYNPNGLVGSISTSGSATAYNTTSDGRLKTNRKPLADEVDVRALFANLSPKAFDWLSATDGKPTGERGHGFVYQEVLESLPDLCVGGEGEPGEEGFEYGSVNQPGLVPYLWAGVEALLKETAESRRRVDELERRLAAIVTRRGLTQ